MNKIIFILVVSIALMTMAIAQNPMVYASKIPEHSKLSLPLEVVLYTNGKKVHGVTVWAEYKEHTEQYVVNMKGKLEQELYFDFPPLDRGYFDFYRVCVKNHSSGEIYCQHGYWFPGTDSTYLRVLVP